MRNSSNIYSDIKLGIKSDAERFTWAAYFLFGLLSSLIGDSLILIASFQEGAFKVSKLIVAVIQHIAIADLGTAILQILSSLISLLANSWLLGRALCYVTGHVSYAIYANGAFFITLLTITKYLLLKYPHRVSRFSTKRIHQVCISIWILSLGIPAVQIAVEKDDVSFDYRTYNCKYGFTYFKSRTVKMMPAIIYGVIPNLVIIATSIPTLQYLVKARKSARRVRGSDPWRGALTVFFTAVTYTISILPFSIYHIAENFTNRHPSERFMIDFHRRCFFLLIINTMVNFYIYCLTIPSFRRYLRSKVLSILHVSSRDRTAAAAQGTINIDPIANNS